MTKLIVEEGGRRRGFKMRPGKVMIGTAEGCALRLESADVAAEHAELTLSETEATLTCRPGVQPAAQSGRPLAAGAKLLNGVPFQLGSAVLIVEFEGQAVAKVAVASAPIQRGQRIQRAGAGDGGRSDEVRRERPQRRSNPFLPVGIIGGALLIALIGWKGLDALISSSTPGYDPNALVTRVARYVKESNFNAAQGVLDQLDAIEEPLAPEIQDRMKDLRADIDDGLAAGRLAVENVFGSKWMQIMLKNFEEFWLAGKPETPEMRVFVKRLAYFKERWPTHPELDWVERQERRFAPLVDLSDPPTYQDLEFEVHLLVGLRKHRITGKVQASRTADWKAALAEIDTFLESSRGDERDSGLSLLDDIRTRRDDWVADKLQQARLHWEDAKKADWDSSLLGKSIAWLVKIVQNSGDEALANDAAQRMIGYDTNADLAAFLRGYKRDKPEAFAALAANSVLAKYIAENDI